MPQQRHLFDVFLEVQSVEAGDPEPGEWAYDDGTFTGPRRVGKTATITPLAAHRARKIPGARMFMTAQNRDKAVKRWRDVADDMLGTPLRRDVRMKVSQSFEELRWLVEQALLVPFAPNEDGLHSETPDLVFIDELWAFSAEDRRRIQAGYVPAFGTSGGQALKMSTAGTPRSVWLNEDVKVGRAAVKSGVRLGRFHLEYGIPDRVGGRTLDVLADDELIQLCVDLHPGVCHAPGCPGPGGRRPCVHGFTVRPAAIRSAWTAMADRDEFIRAWGNRSTADKSESWLGVEEATFTAQIDAAGIPADVRVAIGVDADPVDSRDAAISAGWRDPATGRMHVELTDRRVGTRWAAGVAAGVVERQRPVAVACANVGVARDIADQLERAGVEVLRVSQADLIAASVRHRDELVEGKWFHRLTEVDGETRSPVTDAAEVVEWKGNRWVPGAGPVSAWTSGTLAGWAFDHAPESGDFWMG